MVTLMEAPLDTRTIEIDFEVHKRIELERMSFSEPDNAVLRRLLKIGRTETVTVNVETPTSAQGRPWMGKGQSRGLTLPHGTELAIDYNGKRFTGQVVQGKLIVEGQSFSSPSGAAVALCRTKDGRKTHLNGKSICQVRFPGAVKFVLLSDYERDQMRIRTVVAV